MKKIMILGASTQQLPAILKAKQMGLHTIAVDMDPNAVGFVYADTSLVISTTDVPGVLEAAKQHQIDGVITLASDMPMRAVAAVSEAMGFPCISEETAFRATNKAAMRRALEAGQAPIPAYYAVSSRDEFMRAVAQFDQECIVKPANSAGSRGVFLIRDVKDERQVQQAYEHCSMHAKDGQMMVEEYMRGSEVSVEGVCLDGEVHILNITDKLTTGAPHFVEMGHSQPSRLSAAQQGWICETTKVAVRALGINYGPFHAEVMASDHDARVVELGARLGGGCITTHLLPLSTGIDIVQVVIQMALGEAPDLVQKFNRGAAIRFLKAKPGVLTDIKGMELARAIEGVQEILCTKSIGDTILPFQSGADRFGHVIADAADPAEAVSRCEHAMDCITFVTRPQ